MRAYYVLGTSPNLSQISHWRLVTDPGSGGHFTDKETEPSRPAQPTAGRRKTERDPCPCPRTSSRCLLFFLLLLQLGFPAEVRPL